jgi:3D (Asp-Asp-Asp) domain-containing protein
MRSISIAACLLGLILAGATTTAAPDQKASGPKASAQSGKVVKTISTIKEVPFKTEYRFDRTVTAGRHKVGQKGVPGKVQQVIEVTYVNGKETGRKVIHEREVHPPVNEVILMARPANEQSRGSFTRAKTMEVVATAYSPLEPGLDWNTRSGMRARHGIIAVDPKVIPLGTKVYVEGYGFAIAADTGSAIKGNKIDVCIIDLDEMRRWGRRTVTIHILE